MRGSCLCGKVHYQFNGSSRSVVACHCGQCRKTSGHYVAATQVPTAELEIFGRASMTWYQSSASAERGFCATCGSQLFWSEPASGFTSIMAGSIDGDTHLKMDRQLFVESKGDYYALPDVGVINDHL